MPTTSANFENNEKLYRAYPHYCISNSGGQRFLNTRNKRFNGGIPLLYDISSKRVVVDADDTHSLVFGATGSLKSRTVVMPTVKILGHAGESMIISDPKGEIYAKLAGELKQQGYNIVVVNLRNPAVGNAWNPLYLPYKFFIEGNIDKATEFVNDIANNLMLSETSTSDPFWDFCASDLCFGLILLLFKYCKDHNVSQEAVNIGNLLAIKRVLYANKIKAKDSILWKYAEEDELIAASLSGSIFAPNDTMGSMLSVFDQKIRAFIIQPTLLDMLANNDFDIGDIGKRKTTVFLITPDEKTSYHRLVSLFVKQSYEFIIYTTTQDKTGRVQNRLNYILDEFSSFPAVTDMSTIISAARSRDIRFLLVVQSKHQLIKRYQEEAETIISNCTNWIYLTSREISLLRELSELCGESKNGARNITVYDLQHFSKEKKEALVLCGRYKPAKVHLLDIDDYGEKNIAPLEFVKKTRHIRQKLDFTLSESIKKRLIPEIPKLSNTLTPSLSGESNVITKNEIDNLLSRIDSKIAERETEEKKKEEYKYAKLLERIEERALKLEEEERANKKQTKDEIPNEQ